MVIGRTTHPQPETLRAYGEGRLPPEEVEAVEQHLAGCDACCSAVAEAPADSFVARLRRAERAALAAGDDAPTHLSPADATSLPAAVPIPPELAAHPRYRVLRLLGRGGMGAVYLAEHRHMGRQVALKVINEDIWRQAGALARFQQEVRTAAQLDHPNIVAAYDADEAGELHFLVMEYVEGQNLANYLAAEGPLPLAEACDVARQAALGLQHAHARGMVHRDIKPHNLMRTPAGLVKLLDFGLARLVALPGPDAGADTAPAGPHLTTPGTIVGTADYIAPEQGRDPRGADGRADLYSLGCTLYHLLGGRPPFAEGTIQEKLARHANDEPRPLREVRPDVPEGLAAVVARLMAKRPENRFPSPAEAAAALAPYAGTPGHRHGKQRRRLAVALAAASLVLGAMLAAAPAWRRPAGARQEDNLQAEDAPTSVREERLFAEGLEAVAWRIRVAFSPDGRLVYATSGASPDAVMVWDRQRGTLVKRIAPLASGFAFALSADGRLMAAGDRGTEIAVSTAPGGRPVCRLMGPRAPVWCLAFSPAGDRIAAGDAAGRFFLWELPSGRRLWERQRRPICTAVACSPDGRTLAVSGDYGPLQLFDAATGRETGRLDQPHCYGIVFSRDGRSLLATCNREVWLWDLATGKVVRRLGGHGGMTEGLALAPDGRHLATTAVDGMVRWWDLKTGAQMHCFLAHPGGALGIAVSPDGHALLSSGRDGTVHLWHLEGAEGPAAAPPDAAEEEGRGRPAEGSGEATEVRRFFGHTQMVRGVACSPDGRLAYSASWDRTVRAWDLETGAEVKRLAEGLDNAEVLDLSADGRRLLAGGQGSDLHVLDPATGEVRAVLRGHTGTPLCGALSPDGRRALTGGRDRTLRLWDADTGRQLQVLRGHTDYICAAAFSPDGRLALSGGQDRTVRLWDVESGRELRRFAGGTVWVRGVAFSHDGRRALAPGVTDVRTWDVASGREVGRFTGHRFPAETFAFSPDAGRILSGGPDGTLRVWDANSGTALACLGGDTRGVFRAVFCRGGRYVLGGCGDGTLRLWRVPEKAAPLADGEVRRLVGHVGGRVAAAAFAPDGRHVLSSVVESREEKGLVRVWDCATGRERQPLAGPTDVTALVGVRGGRALSASLDSGVRLWDVAGGKELRCLAIQTDPITALAATPDGRQALVAGQDGLLRQWDLGDDQWPRVLAAPQAGAWAVAVTPDGRRVVSANLDGGVQLWDVTTGQELRRLERHWGPVLAVAVSADGRRVFTGDKHGRVCLWDLETCRLLKSLPAHECPVEGVALAPDGRLALTAGREPTVRLWDLDTGQELRRLDGCSAPVAISPDGRLAVTAGDGAVLRLWRLPDLSAPAAGPQAMNP